ncbi:MAG: IPT/TIG domain-containing protein [Ignavibacteriaceae bacterium]|nr:IPT/TIG domain-containing protein [Ignavibacteriaceae bacterium]
MKKNYLQYPLTSKLLAAFVFVLVLVFWGCNEKNNVEPLYNPLFSNVLAPVITSVSPADSAFAGVDEITITGSNFPDSASGMAVYFNNVIAKIISLDANKVIVKAPNLVKDTINIKISKFSADKLSNFFSYKLISATVVFKEFKFNDTPFSLTFDKLGNAYVSYTVDSVGTGVKKIAPDGTITDFAPKGAETSWSSMKFGQSGDLYAVRGVKGIFKIAPNTTAATWVSSANGIGTIVDFDFDKNGIMWAAGNNVSLYRVTQAKNVKPFSFNANIRSVRVFNNYLYVGGAKDGAEGVWRFPIVNSDSLGTVEPYYNYSTSYPTGTIRGITFSADGDLYIGTDGVEIIVKVRPDKSSQVLFSGVLNPSDKCKFNSFFWRGSDVYLYLLRHAVNLNDTATPPEAIIKVNTLNNLGGAPYYGIQ